MGDTVPHISQTRIELYLDGVPQAHGAQRSIGWYEGRKLEIVVDDVSFELGTASGEGCNCLIDSLHQLLNELSHGREFLIPESCVSRVRTLLEDKTS